MTTRSDLVAAARACAPTGTLRLVLQRLPLQTEGRDAGELRHLDAVADVEGNLVAMRLWPRDQGRSGPIDELEEALSRFEADPGSPGSGGYTLIIDADDRTELLPRTGGPIESRDVDPSRHHDEVFDGWHQIAHHSSDLEDLRDRLELAPAGARLRLRRRIRDLVERLGLAPRRRG